MIDDAEGEGDDEKTCLEIINQRLAKHGKLLS